MNRRLEHLRRDERGMTFVYVGVSFMAFFVASALAIDVGLFMTARSQAQNSADAGALAGAIALVFNDYDNRLASGPAVMSAVNAALENKVVGSDVSVTSSDVTFPLGPTGMNNRVQVTVYRTAARQNPVSTLIGPILKVPTADVIATAIAEASPANAATCVMPFTIPDKWEERSSGPWTVDSEFDMFDKKGKLIANADVYRPGVDGTGYNGQRDKGLELVLKANNESKVAPSIYNPWAPTGSGGASDYRNNIANCNTNLMEIGDLMPAEPGNMVGPTKQGTDDLIAKDPAAYWDEGCNCVKGSNYGQSPRVAVVPLYDPVFYEEGKHTGSNASLRMANYVGFFIVGMNGNEVIGRITPITGLVKGNPGAGETGAFPMAIRLVQ
jgi:Flp pilus assembly protein TadG